MAGGFEALGLLPELIQAVDDLGWMLPTDVQDEAIPLILGGGDVMAAAETGSGKTAAFSLPMIQCCVESLREMTEKKGSGMGGSKTITLNSLDTDECVTVTADGLGCSAADTKKGWAGMRASHGTTTGKFVYEVTVKGSGICRFGWSSMAAHHELGRDAYGFGYGGTAKKSHDNDFADYGEKYSDGDVIMCYVDRSAGGEGVSYSRNGKDLGKAFDLPEQMSKAVLFPALVFKCQGGGPIGCTINFGASAFTHPIKDGYVALATCEKTVSSTERAAYMQEGKRSPLAIILEPARDLAEQVFQNIQDFVRYVDAPKIKPLLIIGGDSDKDMKRQLKEGVDIIVGTPGKIGDLLERKVIDMSQVRFFILDEADRLVEDSTNLIIDVFRACPSGGSGDNRLQVCFFSATLHSPAITALADKICSRPTWVDLKGVDAVPDTVHHVAYRVKIERDSRLLQEKDGAKFTPSVIDDASQPDAKDEEPEGRSKQLKRIKQQVLLGIIDAHDMTQCMIFCRTNQDCDNLEKFLVAHGGGTKFGGSLDSGPQSKYSCCVLAGQRSMDERRSALQGFKSGAVRFLICTDVAARGIDVRGLPFMINMTLPDEPEPYMHRIGRVGRAGAMGLAINIVAEEELLEKVWYHRCNNRGKGCENRKVVDKGGCTIWYNEGDLLGRIEERLDSKVGNMLPLDYTLPEELLATGVVYGESMEEEKYVPNFHLESLRPTVKELAKMEVHAQNVFLNFQMRFANN
jgi:ATP-dependent RNA helicase DDX1